MQLLLLTADNVAGGAAGDGAPLPSLEVLAPEIVAASIDAPLRAVVDAGRGRDGFVAEAILLDGVREPRAARTAALALAGRTELPRIALMRDASLAAITRDWQLADFLTPDASPAEVEVRLRIAITRAQAGCGSVPGAPGASLHGSSQGSSLGSSTGIAAQHGAQGADPSGPARDVSPTAIKVSGVEIDDANFVARSQGRTLDLTYKEFELLYFLASHPARVFTREQLLADVWGTDYFGGTRTVDVHIRRLRAKLGEHEGLISTVRGVGYGFARSRREEEAEA